MCFKRFFQKRCCNRGRTCCCTAGDTSAQVYTLYSLHRFADVPMQIYYGPGYSQQQALESIDHSLATMADCFQTVQADTQRCCGCNRCS